MVQVLIDRFNNTDKLLAIDGCHYWMGSLNPNGYGRIYYKGTSFYAHRVSYFIHKGNPLNLFVCHSCDNRSCVNPNHLFLGTLQDNNNDKVAKNRQSKSGRPSDLCDEDVKEIINLYKSGGLYQHQIAEMFGVRQPAVSRIINGIRRANVTFTIL